MSIVLYAVYTLLNLGLLVWGLGLAVRTRRWSALLIAAVAFGLMYDNLILAVGSRIGMHNGLYLLSLPRFWLHQLVLPWLIYAAFEQARRLGYTWTQPREARRAALISSVLVMLLGILTRLIPLNLQLTEMDGVLRYVDIAAKGPPLVSIFSVGFVGAVGLLHWRAIRYPWLFAFALLVFLGEGIPLEWVRRILGSGAEVLFIAAMLHLEGRLARPRS